MSLATRLRDALERGHRESPELIGGDVLEGEEVGRGITPAAVLVAVLLVSAVLNSAVAVAQTRRLVVDRLTLWTALVLGAGTLIGNWAVVTALARIDAGLTATLQQTQVLWVALLAVPLLGERITGRFVAGMLLALTGFVILSWPNRGTGVLDADLENAVLIAAEREDAPVARKTRGFHGIRDQIW